jgi:hypothetical protein
MKQSFRGIQFLNRMKMLITITMRQKCVEVLACPNNYYFGYATLILIMICLFHKYNPSSHPKQPGHLEKSRSQPKR